MNQFIAGVAAQACGKWGFILDALAISHSKQHSPCPACGGKDRFRFDDRQGAGTWFCNQCEPRSGDGLDLVKNVRQCSLTEAARLVADILGILPKPKAPDLAALMAKATPGESRYLINKGLSGHKLPILPDGSLLLILQNMAGDSTGAQIIRHDGTKKLIAGSRKKGAFIPLKPLPEQAETVVLAEGYATAQSLGLLLPAAVIIAAIDAGNLLPVAQSCRSRWPAAKIIIAADNDVNPQGTANTGQLAAEKVASVVDGWVTLPPTPYKADWDDYRQQVGTGQARNSFYHGLYQPPPEGQVSENKVLHPALSQMAASQRGQLLAEHYGQIAVHAESETVYHYDGERWGKLPDGVLRRELVMIFNANDTPYSPAGIRNAIEAMKLQIPIMAEPPRHLIGFQNGVYDLKSRQFRPHRANDWLQHHNDIIFTEPQPDENLAHHAPYFTKWLTHAANDEWPKMARIRAALFTILSNRFDWQLFLEVTGEGGSGKSVFTHIATLLAGRQNTASGNMSALDQARGRAQFVGKSLITLPDQVKYVGEGAGIKAITGGDLVEIDGKYEKQFSTLITAVVLATNNEPMSFTERQGGIARRRVIFAFNHPVKEADKDPRLGEKIAAELPVVIRCLLAEFADQDKARKLLIEQRDSREAMGVKRDADPLYGFCAHIVELGEAVGMYMGTLAISPRAPRIYLYHAYLAYMEAYGHQRSLSLTKFGKDFPKVMKEFGAEYKKARTDKGFRYNMDLSDTASDWLPALALPHHPQPEEPPH
ncbi:primase-like DNA-binding domain-containing protein [Yersinia proxima]|uniref:primase-like DNA-binding domain-containing protein n=2 Tax=Yersinia proxima TaxID=2890316 RepID=UPI001D0F894B|nr:primase-like DNA-binding domain-containing protein [Yersinia proxima]